MPADPSAAAGAQVTLRDGTRVTLRPIRPDDEARMAVFHAGLSPRSVYQRYFHLESLEQRIAHHRLALACRIDPATGVAVVAEHDGAAGPEILALGRLTFADPPGSAEMALLVVDAWQRRGLGHAMMKALLAAARAHGVAVVRGDLLADNDAMHALVRSVGFVVRSVAGDARVLRAELELAR